MLKKREVFWQHIPHEEEQERFWHEKPHDLPLPPGLALRSTCLLSKAGYSAAALPLRGCLLSDPSLTECLHADRLSRACYRRPATSSWTYLHLLVVQDQPRCCCSPPVLLPQTIRTSCNRTAAGSWWWLSPLYAILASFYCPSSLPHHPTTTSSSWNIRLLRGVMAALLLNHVKLKKTIMSHKKEFGIKDFWIALSTCVPIIQFKQIFLS